MRTAEAAESRSTRLKRSGFDSQAALDKVTGDLDAARSKLARTRAAIEQKSLKAPFTGTIGIPRIDLGQYVSAGTVVATLQDLDNMSVDFAVPEQFITKVSIDQNVQLGFTENRMDLSGKIIGIDPRGDPQTRLVNVRASITAQDVEKIIPGRFLHVRVELPKEDGVIAVPQTAVVTSLYGDYAYKVVDGDGDALKLQQVFVQTGRREGRLIEITGGLASGDTIVTSLVEKTGDS